MIWLLLVDGQLDPQFDQATVNVTAIQGEDAVMPCAVINKGTYQVVALSCRPFLQDVIVVKNQRVSKYTNF